MNVMSDTSDDEGIQMPYEDPIDLSRLKDVVSNTDLAFNWEIPFIFL